MSDEFDDIMAESKLQEAYTHDDADAVRGASGKKRLRWKASGVGYQSDPEKPAPKKEPLNKPWDKWQISDQQEFTYYGKKYRAAPAEELNPNLKNAGYSRCKFCAFAERKGGGGMSVDCWFIPPCEAKRREDGNFVIFEEVKYDGSDNNK